jgi:hypothetical protein
MGPHGRLAPLLLSLAAAACAGRAAREADRPFTGGLARVESLAVVARPADSDPLRVIARGTLPDACTRIDGEERQRRGRYLTVTLTTRRESDARCPEEPTSFSRTIVIPLAELHPGLYTLDVNGVRELIDVTHPGPYPEYRYELD